MCRPAINAARGQLPANLPRNPTWRKANPAESPIMVLALTSDTATQQQLYDMADSILAQKISQISGVGQVNVGGSSQPAVRVEVNPLLLSKLGVSLDQVRIALAQANANAPKGSLADHDRRLVLDDNDQLFVAQEYAPADRCLSQRRPSAPLRCGQGRSITSSTGCNAGSGERQALGPHSVYTPAGRQYHRPRRTACWTSCRCLQASIPPSIRISVSQDRTTTIRASVHDVEVTLVISVLLVILVVFVFLAQCLGHRHSQHRRAPVAGGHLWRHVSGWATPSTISP